MGAVRRKVSRGAAALSLFLIVWAPAVRAADGGAPADRVMGDVRLNCNVKSDGGMGKCEFAAYADPILRLQAKDLLAVLRFTPPAASRRDTVAPVLMRFTATRRTVRIVAETPGAPPIDVVLGHPDGSPDMDAYAAVPADGAQAPGWTAALVRCRVDANADHSCWQERMPDIGPTAAAIGDAAARRLGRVTFSPTTIDGRPVGMTLYYMLAFSLPLREAPTVQAFADLEIVTSMTCAIGPQTSPARCDLPIQPAMSGGPDFPLGAYVALPPPPPGQSVTVRFPVTLHLSNGRHVIRAEPEGAPPTEIVKPDWLTLPGREDFSRAYPVAAVRRGVSGDVDMACLVEVTGLLSHCQVTKETPADQGFGAAALSVAPKFRLKPGEANGQVIAGMPIMVPVAFRSR